MKYGQALQWRPGPPAGLKLGNDEQRKENTGARNVNRHIDSRGSAKSDQYASQRSQAQLMEWEMVSSKRKP